MYTIEKLLTHKDPRMAQRYAHLRDETLSYRISILAPVKSKQQEGVNRVAILKFVTVLYY